MKPAQLKTLKNLIGSENDNDIVNWMQDRGLCSDNAVTSEDVASEDADKAIAVLQK